MQSYVVALTVAEYATREQEQRTKAITRAVNEFERRLNSPGLVKAIPNKPNDSLRILYHEIYSDFYGMLKPMAEQVIENPSTEAKFLNYVPSFVSKVDKFVFDIEQKSGCTNDLASNWSDSHLYFGPLLGAVFLIYFQRVFFLPLKALADVASAVRKGNFTVRSNYKKKTNLEC